MKRLVFKAVIPLPVQQVNLHDWLVNVSESDYQRFAKGHRAIGLCKKDGLDGMVNVEVIGGNLLVQHYTFLKKLPHEVVLFSEKSEAYMFHLLRLYVSVEWAMSVTRLDNTRCEFICEIGVKYPNRLLPVAAQLSGGNYFLRKHLDEEGRHFAQDIERKFSLPSEKS